MWDRIRGPEAYHNIVKAVDGTLSDDRTKQCIERGVSHKEAKCFRYTDADFTLLLYVYKCKTKNYWVFNYALSGTYDVAVVGRAIMRKIRNFIEGTDAEEFRIRVTSETLRVDRRVLVWIKNNAIEYKPEDENTRLDEQVFERDRS